MTYELIVIGGGSAGHAAARTAASLGLKCALIEAPGPLGGLCILRGCMPSKTLIETANRMREIRDAGRFGIDVGKPALDLEKLRARLEELGKDFREHRQQEMKESGYDLIRGEAAFIASHEVAVKTADGSQTNFQAKAFIIATGSKPNIPEIPGLAGTPFWTSDDMVKLPAIPDRIAIIGAGAIGMECAHLFEGFGSKVTLIARSERILSSMDADIAEAIEAESSARGIEILNNTEVHSVEYSDGKFYLTLIGAEKLIETDLLMVATGRRPNTSRLNLEKIGIAMNGKLILIDDRCATSAHHIFAAGDCASPVPVVHLAVIQGEVAAKNAERIIRDGHSELSAEWSLASAMDGLFTEPQCIQIGMNLATAREKNIEVITGTVFYNDQGKGMIAGSRHGFAKIIASEETRRIIGATGVGPLVLESSHVVQLAVVNGLTLEEYVDVPHYHPTFVEAWASAAQHAIESHPLP